MARFYRATQKVKGSLRLRKKKYACRTSAKAETSSLSQPSPGGFFFTPPLTFCLCARFSFFCRGGGVLRIALHAVVPICQPTQCGHIRGPARGFNPPPNPQSFRRKVYWLYFYQGRTYATVLPCAPQISTFLDANTHPRRLESWRQVTYRRGRLRTSECACAGSCL